MKNINLDDYRQGFWVIRTGRYGGTNRIWCSSESDFQRLQQDGNTISIIKEGQSQ